MSNEPTPISTVISEVPQLQTVLQDGLPPISSIVNAPWVSVTSVNGQTGDVEIEAKVGEFTPYTFFSKGSIIVYNGFLYYANEDFTSDSSFNSSDWNTPTVEQQQADWSVTNMSSPTFIKNKPTNLSQFANDSDFIDETTLNDAIDGLDESIGLVSNKLASMQNDIASVSSSVNTLNGSVTALDSSVSTLSSSLSTKVDKETGKGLSSNDFTNDYKSLLDNIRTTIFEQTYPIGSIYPSTSLSTAAQVATTLGGGTWEAYGQGRVLVGKATSGTFGTVGNTGGETTHTLTEAEIPQLTGHIQMHSAGAGTNLYNATGVFTSQGGTSNYYRSGGTQATGAMSLNNIEFSAGSGQAHNNLQPYVVVYMWRRTA